MNYVSLILAALPQILAIVEELVAAGKGVNEAQNAVQSNEAIRTAHPEVRAAINTLTAHLVQEIQNRPALPQNPVQNEPASSEPTPSQPEPATVSLPSLK